MTQKRKAMKTVATIVRPRNLAATTILKLDFIEPPANDADQSKNDCIAGCAQRSVNNEFSSLWLRIPVDPRLRIFAELLTC